MSNSEYGWGEGFLWLYFLSLLSYVWALYANLVVIGVFIPKPEEKKTQLKILIAIKKYHCII